MEPLPGQERRHPARPAGRPRSALRLIAYRNFGPYFVGNAVSATGTWFQNLAAALLVYRLTHSAFLLGVLTFSQFVPNLVLAPWTGAAADRLDRRRLIAGCQLAAAALAWLDLASAAVVIGIAGGLGVSMAFTAPAAQALLGSLVEPDELPAAVALNSVTYNLARAVGPALAGVAVASLGIPASFALNAGSYLLLVAGVMVVRPRPYARPPGHGRFRDSLHLVRSDPALLGLLAVVAVVGISVDPINTLAPAFAHAFGRPDTDAGFVIGVFGAGAVTAAFVWSGRVAGTRRRIALMLALFGGGIVVFSILPSLPLALAVLFAGGFGYLSSNTAATTRLQLRVEPHERGRMMALWTVAFLGLRPLASLVDGTIASGFGVRSAGVAMAVPALLAAAGILLVERRTRRARLGLTEP